jgi:hypothetical protein
MHKIVKELAEKSGYNVSYTETQHNGHIMRNLLEKYARNIARECSSLCTKEEDKKTILNHFGIVD